MHDNQIFNSRSLDYKRPYGAVTPGTTVEFTLRPQRSEGFSRGTLVVKYEFDDSRSRDIPLVWTDTDRGIDVFTASLEVGDYVGLIWYSFRLELMDLAQDGEEGDETIEDEIRYVVDPDWDN